MPQQEELGGPIYDVKYKEDLAFIKFGKSVENMWRSNEHHKSMPMAPNGAHVWKTADAEIGEDIPRFYVIVLVNTHAKLWNLLNR